MNWFFKACIGTCLFAFFALLFLVLLGVVFFNTAKPDTPSQVMDTKTSPRPKEQAKHPSKHQTTKKQRASSTDVRVPKTISSCVESDLGTIVNHEVDNAKKLYQIIQLRPGRDVYIVSYTSWAGKLQDRGKLVYIPEFNELGLTVSSKMQDYSEEFWRVWPNIQPKDFEEGLPYGERSRPSVSDITAPGPFPLNPVLTMVRQLEEVETL